MTVRTLIEELKACNPDAIVYISNPNHFGSNLQVAHEEAGIRYTVNGNEEVWFETYGGENIAEEVNTVVEEMIDWGCSDEELVSELIDPNCHGYTWSDLYYNLPFKQFWWLRKTAKEHGLL